MDFVNEDKEKFVKPDNSASLIKTPMLTTTLDQLIEGGRSKKNKKHQNKAFNLKGVMDIFESYEKQTTSLSVKTAIQNIKIELNGSDICILSPTQIYLDFIRQESPLVEILHETYSNSYEKILYQVSEKTFPHYAPPKKPKHLTTSEKYDLLTKKNPLFIKLVDTFKLKIINN